MLKNNHNKIKNKAFTLVELMVTISIFLVISSVVIFNYGDFKSTVSLQNLTDDIALSIRKAQGFAIGVRNIGGGNFNNSYGIDFSVRPTGDTIMGSRKSYLIFSNTSKIYVPHNPCSDCVEVFTINTPDYIKEIWLDGVNKTPVDPGGVLDIVFTRPNPRAYFCYKKLWDSNPCDQTVISNVSIVVSNGKTGTEEKTKTITVQNTGQISIQ